MLSGWKSQRLLAPSFFTIFLISPLCEINTYICIANCTNTQMLLIKYNSFLCIPDIRCIHTTKIHICSTRYKSTIDMNCSLVYYYQRTHYAIWVMETIKTTLICGKKRPIRNIRKPSKIRTNTWVYDCRIAWTYICLHFLHRLVKHLSKKNYSVNMIFMENFLMLQI